MALSSFEIQGRARKLRLILLDVDGVLTDGLVSMDSHGGEAKAFSIRDGAAIKWAQSSGLAIGLLSGRPSEATTRRARELGIETVVQGGTHKLDGYAQILQALGLADEQVAYMGDDLQDLPVIARAGLSGSPADAAAEVLANVHWISERDGGRGAVREFIELVLKAQGRWNDQVRVRAQQG
jgi:3-deoxy-D-manno-octulosonate 8-phosphate phosphatase (KDO 8-P phosphatase)